MLKMTNKDTKTTPTDAIPVSLLVALNRYLRLWSDNIFVNFHQVYKRGLYCVESVRIRRFSGPYFPAFGLNMERYFVPFRIQSECGNLRTRKTPNTNTFHAVLRKHPVKYLWLTFLTKTVKGFQPLTFFRKKFHYVKYRNFT